MLTDKERAEVIAVYAKINAAPDPDAALAKALKKYPNLLKWDEKGNYVGAVANENGWTP